VDLQMSRLIYYAILLGLEEEASVMAAAVSQSKTLFRLAFPFIHTNPAEFNDIIKTNFLGATALDDG